MTMTTKITKAARAASLLGMAALFTLLTIPYALGDDIYVKGNVPFPFQAGTKTLPAGDYQFRIDDDRATVTILSANKKDTAKMLILTRLAATPHSTATDAHIVFDMVGTTYTLSELSRPGDDGILVYETKGKHEHHVLHVKP